MDAATIEISHHYAVFIDSDRFSSIAEMKEAIAHEVGHCATGCTHKVSSSLDLIEKHEYKANRWAVERYLPFETINSTMKKGYKEPWELAEQLSVPEHFIKMAIYYYTEIRGMKFN